MEDRNEIEEKKERFGNKKLLLILFIFIITFGAFGISISVMNSIKIPGKDNIINNIIAIDKGDKPGNEDNDDDKDSSSKLVFSYYEKPGVGNGIKLYNQFPTKDEIGKAFEGDNYVFEFRLILNENAAGVKYNLVAEKTNTSTLRENLVKTYLESEGKALSSVIRDNGSIKTFNEYSNYTKKNSNQKLIYTGVITKAEALRGYKDFVFKMWISDDAGFNIDDNAKTFVTKINVYANKDM